MAWRIHDSVIRGEIDNRQRDLVQGKLWLCGQPDPVRLELAGNAAPDLAGCLLSFENPNEPVPLRLGEPLAPVQRGTIGDLTASRKVRVLDMPTVEAYLRKKKGLPVPEHLANCIYLEWFSEANGRVVIESADYRLTVSTPDWRLSPEEEDQRKRNAAAGFAHFLEQLGDGLTPPTKEPGAAKEWDEFDYEQFMRASDVRTDRYSELLDKYLDHPDRDRIIAREMGWTWLEEALDNMADHAGPPEPSDRDFDSGDAGARDSLELDDGTNCGQPDPATEGVDWIRNKDGRVCHPLSLRAFEGSLRLWDQCEELRLDHAADADLHALMTEYQLASAKIACALDGLAFRRRSHQGPLIVARLKRVLQHLQAAQCAAENLASKHLLPGEALAMARGELVGLREEILRLMKDFRGFK